MFVAPSNPRKAFLLQKLIAKRRCAELFFSRLASGTRTLHRTESNSQQSVSVSAGTLNVTPSQKSRRLRVGWVILNLCNWRAR